MVKNAGTLGIQRSFFCTYVFFGKLNVIRMGI